MLAAALALSAAAIGCAQPHRACAPTGDAQASTASAAPSAAASPRVVSSDRHVYRLDFVLSTEDGAAAPSLLSFTVTLQELEKGEVSVGKNVALSSAGATSQATMPSARQDVGIKISTVCHTVGDDVLLEVSAEVSSFEPPTTVRRVVVRGDALAVPGKPTQVATLEEDHRRHQLTVTSTKLR